MRPQARPTRRKPRVQFRIEGGVGVLVLDILFAVGGLRGGRRGVVGGSVRFVVYD